ncbi:three-helix bundle dimerization domain-containing protein [Kribbella albertanoniae]|uniref:three-helix bundle dimerization domain-containing protein n=1 Tax=Kribbella albertanoniae TaxID=1266829 RepID=UPI00308409A6
MVLGRAAERLADKYTGIFSPETVDRVVHESYVALYRTARVHRHLPALAEHFAGDRLAALCSCQGRDRQPRPAGAVPVCRQRWALPDGCRSTGAPRCRCCDCPVGRVSPGRRHRDSGRRRTG